MSERELSHIVIPQDDGSKIRILVTEVPAGEEPRWWTWDTTEWGYWRTASTCSGAQTNKHFTTVWATESTRDAKRDALLAAAKAAGKGGEG